MARAARKRRDDDEIWSSSKRSKVGEGPHLLNELGGCSDGIASRSTSPIKRDGPYLSNDLGVRSNGAAGKSISSNTGDGPDISSDSGARVDGTVTKLSGGSFPESKWIYATTPAERHYIVQNKSCGYIKPHTNEHWKLNGPIQKCTTCTAKATGGGSCRFEGLRAFAAVAVGEELKCFEYDVRIHDMPQTTLTTTVTDTRNPKKKLPKGFKPALTGFKGSEQPDFRDWVLLGTADDLGHLALPDLVPSNFYPHGISEAASRIETVAKGLTENADNGEIRDNVTAFLSKANHSALDILRLVAPTLHKILVKAAPYFTAGDAGESPTIFRLPVQGERVTCDSCGTTCFLGSWMCVLCGRERCVDCWNGWHNDPGLLTPRLDKCASRKRHTRNHFYMVSRTSAAEINWLLCHTSPEVWTLIQGEASRFMPPHHTLGSGKFEGPLPVDLLASFREFIHQSNGDPLLRESIGPLTDLSLPETFSYRGRPLANDTYIPLLENSRPLLPTFDAKDLSPEILPFTDCLFRDIWHLQGDRARGMPIVISGMLNRFNVAWTPDYFINNHDSEQCWVVDCSTNETLHGGEIVTVGEFFQSFETHNFRGVTSSMKLKDWPPHEDFATHFPELFQDFQKALPFPNRMSRGGFANLASHFPIELLQPDLGPKMYCAHPAPEFFDNYSGEEKGSTRLHLDVTCAINIMVYATPPDTDPERPSPPGAIWDIFEPRDTRILNEYLRQKYPLMGVDDPVNRQLFYLSSDDLSILNTEKWGYTKSFRVFQGPGDAVLIPAGCAHQVANGRSSIKVAVDFIAAERIHVCEDVMTMFRDMAAQYKYPLRREEVRDSKDGGRTKAKRSTTKNQRRAPAAQSSTKVPLPMKEDILQLYNCLYLTYFQIRGLNLSVKLGSYGPGPRGVDAIFGSDFSYWNEVANKGIAHVAKEDGTTLKGSKGVEGVGILEAEKVVEMDGRRQVAVEGADQENEGVSGGRNDPGAQYIEAERPPKLTP
ncbi:hypothetical protein FGG08_005931 [Glutinoglossum americanum]|uniref:JmjC domain-containing protein n=1 Tax=Glutinoglossum americanum TaxID=1670608 RepID=A0A9P8L0Y6_9PEZI|nr:hypothetical protein FGG08_005931 [Glutinoglossum americanum]